ncbi:MAG: porin family protein [Hyphomicrobiales bacterium]|nr:porin family protein [Hyphomicrobiales bacterium]
MRFVRILAAALAASTIAGAASAADLPYRKAPPAAPYVAPPVFTWTGLYVGVNGGGWINNSSINYGFTKGKLGGGGGLVGGTIGYNWQMGNNFVAGLETDLDYRTKTNVTPPYASSSNVSDGYLGTARVRVGYAMDRALLYVTGGLAYGSVVAPQTLYVLPSFVGSQSSNSSALGWSAGAGVEFAINNNWSVKGEYLYAGLGNKSVTYTALGNYGTPVVQTGEHTARLGVNYHFNFGGPGGAVRY